MEYCLEIPINPVSFGQVSVSLLREMKGRGLDPCVFPINNPDLSTHNKDEDFEKWLSKNILRANKDHDRNNTSIKLWHLNGALSSVSKEQLLFTFYELDNPTQTEVNIAKNNNVVTSSKYSQQVFESRDVKTHYVPLGFDSFNFKRIEKDFFQDGRITFNLCGKFEHRKHHAKIIRAWLKKFGNNKKYYLQCSNYNNFFSPEDNQKIIQEIVQGNSFFNVNFVGFMSTNNLYNDFLNSSNIIIGMSGGEGWGLPEFQSTAMGKHSVILNAHAYKDWANEENSILVPPSGKINAYDGKFFVEGTEYNQGQIFDWNEDDFISACEEAIKRVESNPTNEEGLKLQEEFTYSKTLDKLLELI
tara:strand:+ start:1926 stop:2999 length:1074 start_codon:yes stop_codon:yes gene_type:complete